MTHTGALFDRIGARIPVIEAPMAGAGGVDLAVAAIAGGGVGSLPCAMLTPAAIVEQAAQVRASGGGPLNLNFFCHRMPVDTDAALARWRTALQPYYAAEGVDDGPPPPARRPFDGAAAEAVEGVRPAVVSFHFGLPAHDLLARVRAAGALILGNATTIAEAVWLEQRGCDAIIAQGFEAGGHAGHFLDGHHPTGTLALVPQIVDAVAVPVIAAGGIADARGVAAAMALGAAGVQVGSAYLACHESLIAAPYRARLGHGGSVFTNLFSGGIARGLRNRLMRDLGPISDLAPPFPLASAALAPLRAKAEAEGRDDFSPLWAGQAAPLARETSARRLTEILGAVARRHQEAS